jgi:cytochrome c553
LNQLPTVKDGRRRYLSGPATATPAAKLAAWLEGRPSVYRRSQLQAFRAGTRHNDIGKQMRDVTRRTLKEIDTSSRFYADRP